MLQIAKTEWLKMKKYPAFWWVMGITALTYPGINYLFINGYENITARETATGKVVKALLGNPFAFPETWHTVAYFSSYLVFIPAIVIIMLITNEFNYKTNRQNIIDGWSRKEFMTGKLIDVLFMSALVTILYYIVALIIGVTNTTAPAADAVKWKLIYYVALFALQTFSQLSLAFMVGFLVRKSFIALAIFVFYFIIAEPILSLTIQYWLKSNFHKYLPIEISNRLIPRPAFFSKLDEAGYTAALNDIKYHVGYTILLILLTWAFCFWLNNRRDL